MFVSVELYLRSEQQLGLGRSGFWRTFKAARDEFAHSRARDDERRELPTLSLSEIEEYEEKFRSNFPGKLEENVNLFLPTVAARTWRRRVAPIRVKLVSIQYGSIKPILDIVGIENSDIQNFVLTALSVYAPTAFNEALGSHVDIEVGVPEVLDEAQSATTRTNDVATRAWAITNFTLVVPVVLSLLVVYYAYSGLLHELEGLRSQATEIRLERSDIVKALVEQNRALSASNSDQAKQALANAKVMQEALVAILKDRGFGSAAAK
jgi:hypothetical protein